MGNIFVFLAQPIILLVDFISNTLLYWKREVPEAIIVLNALKDCGLISLQVLNTLFLLRFILAWFPNINPYIQPYYIVIHYTQPILNYLEKRLPKVFGFDFSFFLCTLIIQQSIIILQKFKF